MATKHIVKCFYCGKTFDLNQEEGVKVNSRRYAHKYCVEAQGENALKELKDKDEFYQYCSQVLGKDYNYIKTSKLVEKYRADYGFTYSGMRRTLQYHYEVKKNKYKEGDSVGIIPYVYEEAKKYYRDIWLINQRNEATILEHYEPKTDIVTIKSPVIKKRKTRFFNFLDLEGEKKDE